MKKDTKRNNVIIERKYADFSEELLRAKEDFEFYNKSRNLAESTITYHNNSIRELGKLMNHFGIDRLMEIKENTVREYILFKLDGSIKPKTINQYLRTWKPFGKYLLRKKYIKEDPFTSIENLFAEKELVQTFTEDELKILFDMPDRNTFTGFRDYVFMLLLIETGVRISEAINIKLNDIKWKEGTIKIYGKGRKERIVPFQNYLEKQLKDYVRYRGTLDTDYLFVSIENKPLKVRSIQDNLNKYGKKARLKVRCNAHNFRHTFAKFYVMNGGEGFSLQRILGHTSMEMVSYYVSLFSKDISRQHEKFSPLNRLID